VNQSIIEVTPIPVEEKNLADGGAKRLPLHMWILNMFGVVTPFAGLVIAISMFWGWGFSWVDLGLLLGMYLVSALGITVGFHRLFAHRSFETSRVVQCILGILGSMAVQGSLIKWVAQHRCHHQHSDLEADPHSPHTQGQGIFGFLYGLWHAHLGWIFSADPANLSGYVKDLRQSRLLRAVSALFPLWIVVGLLIPAALEVC